MKKVNYEVPRTDVAVLKFERYLRSQGYRESTLLDYVGRIKRYLGTVGTIEPTTQQAEKFREGLIDKRLSKSSINNYSFAIQLYHGMLGTPLKLPHLPLGDKLPYFFDGDDIQEVFYCTTNIKYLAMLQVGFYSGLRASEICALDDDDLNLADKTVRVRGGKGDRDAMLYINDECVATLKEYLKRRPDCKIKGKQPLFYTRDDKRYDRRMIYSIFRRCKDQAGIKKPGGLHVFCRHSSATLMLKNGCDILTIKELLRHRNISTTEKYCHLADQTKREKHDRYLKL